MKQSGRNVAPLNFKIENVAETPFRAASFWPTLGEYAGTWAFYLSARDSKLIPEDFGFQSNRQRKNNWTLTLEQSGRNIVPLNFKTEKVVETTLRTASFWPTLDRFASTWAIFPSPRDSKRIAEDLGSQSSGQRKNNWTLTLEQSGPNIAPLNFKTEKVAETALRAAWFWPTLGRFAGTWAIFPSPRDSKVVPEDFGFQSNGQRKNNWTLTLENSGRNIASLNFKTEKVVETALRAAWFWPTLGRFAGTWAIFPSPRDSKVIPEDFDFQSNGQRKNN